VEVKTVETIARDGLVYFGYLGGERIDVPRAAKI
jgi:hypothetical protein